MNGGCADTELVANATNFVGKSNLYCMKRVIDEFCHLCRTISRIEDRRLDSCVQLVKSRAPFPSFVPITIFGGLKKSSIATDSRKNSGL